MRSFSLWCSFWLMFFEKMSYCMDDGIGNECVENEVHACIPFGLCVGGVGGGCTYLGVGVSTLCCVF